MTTIIIPKYKEDFILKSDNRRQLSGSGVAAAIVLHAMLLLIMVVMQHHAPFNTKLPPSVRVDLVSYSPKPEDLLKSKKKQSKKIIKKKSKPKKNVKKHVKKIAKPIEKPRVKKEKEFSEKKIDKTSKIIEAAKKDIEKRVEDQEQNKIKDILSELSEKVAEQEMEDDYEEEDVAASSFKAWGTKNIAEGIYNGILMASVQHNWVFNERLANLEKNKEKINVLVMIKILRNGRLADIWIETKSGNEFLDRSAMRAIKKAAPFKPLPAEFKDSTYELGLLFSPKGLK